MNTKQWIALIAALLIFCGIGAVTAVNINQRMDQAEGLISSLADDLTSFALSPMDAGSYVFPDGPFVAKLDIEGTIMSGSSATLALTGGFNEDAILDYIGRLIECPENVGLLLYINSGGGEMSASDEIYLRLMDYKEQTGRPIFAYFDSLACSGAYYIAMAADEIRANRNSVCVNIGVYIETYNLSGLFEKYGIEEVLIRSSDNKAIGAMGHPWTEEQLAIYQSIVDEQYAQFLDVVAQGRGMTPDQVRSLDDGREMTASQALDAGFVDGIGRYEEYKAEVLSRFGENVTLCEAEETPSFLTLLYGAVSSLVPVSEEKMLRDFVRENSGIVVMAYAG